MSISTVDSPHLDRMREVEAARWAQIQERPLEFLPALPYAQWREEPLCMDDLDESSRIDAGHETLLFRQMHLAYYRAAQLREQLQSETPSAAQLDEIDRLCQRGNRIRNRLAIVFHKLTLSIARSFVTPRFPLDDLASEAHTTLLYALSKFDPERGFRFSTYATHAIRRRILRYMRQQQNRGEVAVDWQSSRLAETTRWTPLYERQVTRKMAMVEQLLRELAPRERYIIRARFGCGREFDARTLQDIAQELGVSRERVRQLESRALAKLQRWVAARGLE